MAVNELGFNDIATVLAEIHKQATGADTIAPLNTGDFVSVAQATLLAGYDKVLNAVSQVLSRTAFSIRPYERKFKGLFRDSMRWGNHVRKIQMSDAAAEADQRFDLENGESIDQQVVNKPNVLQTNFYGQNVYQRHFTIFKDQLDMAFSSPEEFQRFCTMVMQNTADLIEQEHENTARAALNNFILGKIKGDEDNVIHLVTEYNDITGENLDSDTVKAPENFIPFMKWAFARIESLSDFMTERSIKYHTNITDHVIARHTPKAMQSCYLLGEEVRNMEASVLSSVYHDNYLKGTDFELVNFWQSIDAPDGLQGRPTYLKSDGTLFTVEDYTVPDESEDAEEGATVDTYVTASDVFGVIFDQEAIGITTINEWSQAAPFNAAGGYQNTFFHFTDRYYNDFTENGIVLKLD